MPANGQRQVAAARKVATGPQHEAYPATYHMGLFPWLLSAERQRIPADDLEVHAASAQDEHWKRACIGGGGAAEKVLRYAPLPVRRRLAHELNMHIARAALGSQAIDDVCRGAELALYRVTDLLSRASSAGGQEAEAGLAQVLTRALLDRYTEDLRRLRTDNVRVELDIAGIHSARIHQLRTQSGSVEALAALEAAVVAETAAASGSAKSRLSALRVGLAKQSFRFSRTLGAVRAAPATTSACKELSEAVRVRVDVELGVDMRYRLIGGQRAPKTIVDDNATRNLMLTLESTRQDQGSMLEWRVADIDYLLSSELRIQQEFEEAHIAC
ncbi:hypothetical protein H4S02_007841 [Coemansia sp. RSA 2611]|nr:hypothetical protein LPJ60_001738 [Coemansia sp. RSA 2675]KAJ2376740.1 hypothetical protein H4S02_007841 [Coemansia sp. RSA 2611]KAJ2703281.1 hypothetical protein H4218_000363 [Coemansia sp. IMI 209128]